MTKQPRNVTDETDELLASVVRHWSEDKHQALIKYVEGSRGARRRFQHSSYVDLYCGPGRAYIEDEARFADGSPLAIAKAARACGAPFSTYCINDGNSAYVSACKARLERIGVTPMEFVGDAQENIKRIVGELPEDGLTLAFLDPYNLLPFITIQELARLKNVDVLMHLSIYDLQRNVFRHVQDKNPKLEAFAPGVLEAVEACTHNQVLREVRDYWVKSVESTGLKISERFKTVKGYNNVPYYWLVLASRHPLADKIWSSIVSAGEERRLFQ